MKHLQRGSFLIVVVMVMGFFTLMMPFWFWGIRQVQQGQRDYAGYLQSIWLGQSAAVYLEAHPSMNLTLIDPVPSKDQLYGQLDLANHVAFSDDKHLYFWDSPEGVLVATKQDHGYSALFLLEISRAAGQVSVNRVIKR